MLDINAETPVNTILNAEGVNQRALMTRLACMVFGKAEGHILRAYTQFSPKALATLIEGRRKGVFDYGETIRKLGVGAWTFPKDPNAVLTALDLAVDEKYDEVDLEALMLVDDAGAPIIDLTRLFPTMKTGRKPTTKTKAKPKLEVVKTPLEAVEVPAAPKPAPEPKAEERPKPRVPVREREIVQSSAPRDSEGNLVEGMQKTILDSIDTLASNLSEVLEGMHKQTTSSIEGVQDEMNQHSAELGLVVEQQRATNHNLAVLAAALATFDRNVRQLSLYFVDPNMEFEELELEFATHSLEEGARIPQSDDRGGPVVECEPDDKGSSIQGANEYAEEPNEGDESTDRYTQEELEAMELQDLRDYAESIGCTPARWMKTNVNRILEEYARQDGEG